MIKVVKIKNHRISWERIREIFVLFLWSAILTVAAFGWGMIYENRQNEDLRREVYKIENKVRDQDGRIIALEGKPGPKR